MSDPIIIDAHVHLYETKEQGIRAKEGYPLWEYGTKEDLHLSNYSGDVEDVLKAMEEAGASKCVVVHLPEEITSVPAAEGGIINEEELARVRASMGEMFKKSNLWACELNKKHPEIVPFIGVDPWVLSTNEMEAHLRDMAKRHNARGVKVHPVVQRFYMHDERMMPIWSACVELGLPIMAHSGPAQGVEQYAEPRAYKTVLETFPQLKIVMAHMGGASWRQLPEVSSYQNAYYDICEIIQWMGASNGPTETELAKLIKKVGPERVMMGSDFPWYDIDHTIKLLMELPLLTKDEKEAILGANAVRIFDI